MQTRLWLWVCALFSKFQNNSRTPSLYLLTPQAESLKLLLKWILSLEVVNI